MTTKLKQQAIGNIDATSVNGYSASDLMPVGSILPFAGSTAPDYFLLCSGQEVSRTTYADLFSVIGTTYGAGNGSTTFNLPNLEGRVPVGKSSETEFSGLGQTGGAKTHTLTVSEMPSHQHSIRGDARSDSIGIKYSTNGSSSSSNMTPLSDGANTSTYTGKLYAWNTGGGLAHNNLQPYITVYFFKRTA